MKFLRNYLTMNRIACLAIALGLTAGTTSARAAFVVQYGITSNIITVADNAAGRTTRTLTLDVSAVSLSSSAGTQIPLSTGGATGWFNDPKISHDTAASIRSGIVQDGEQSWCRANVTGPAMLSFWWMSSGRPSDYAMVLCNETPERQIGGITGWRREFIEIPAGTHEVSWLWELAPGPIRGCPRNRSSRMMGESFASRAG